MNILLPVDEHAWRLECILRTLNFDDQEDSWQHICSWLQMASGLDEVNLITEKFESSIGFCSGALTFENERSAMLSNLVKELTIFNFIWGAFESLIETLEPLITECNIESFGKVKTACYILRKSKTPIIIGYDESLRKLQSLFNSLITKNVNHKHIPYSGKGIYIVSKIRNQYAHGAFSLPFHPEDFPDPEINHTVLINISSRIILLSTQMLLLSYFGSEDIDLEPLYLFPELYELESMPLNTLLESIHLHEFKDRYYQN